MLILLKSDPFEVAGRDPNFFFDLELVLFKGHFEEIGYCIV